MSLQEIEIQGHADEPFAPLADVFARLLASQPGGGAALSIYLDGRPVVDLWGGDYREDTLQLVHSVSKVVSAIAAQIAVDEGLLDLDQPLSSYWPEFDRADTRSITLRQVLQHRSGLCAVDVTLNLADLVAGEGTRAIEKQTPYWEPGTAHGYHGFTLGSLLDGAFERVLGTTVGRFVEERIRQPLGIDLWIGLPESELPRVSRIEYSQPAITPLQRNRTDAIVDGHFRGDLGTNREVFNSPELLMASWPAVNGVMQARALSRMLAATMGEVDGVRLVSERALSELTTVASKGYDRVLGIPSTFSTGLQLGFPQLPFLGPHSFGHEAAGGSIAFGDTEFGVSVGFTTDRHQAFNGASPAALALLPTIRHLLVDAGIGR